MVYQFLLHSYIVRRFRHVSGRSISCRFQEFDCEFAWRFGSSFYLFILLQLSSSRGKRIVLEDIPDQFVVNKIGEYLRSMGFHIQWFLSNFQITVNGRKCSMLNFWDDLKSVEFQKTRSQPLQCFHYQGFGHIQSGYRQFPLCVKCGKKIFWLECPKSNYKVFANILISRKFRNNSEYFKHKDDNIPKSNQPLTGKKTLQWVTLRRLNSLLQNNSSPKKSHVRGNSKNNLFIVGTCPNWINNNSILIVRPLNLCHQSTHLNRAKSLLKPKIPNSV